MAVTQKLRKWHFLLLGAMLIFLSAYLWYWNWRVLDIPKPLQPEHWITFASFVVGLFVMCVFIYRLTRRQVTIMLVGTVIVNLLVTLATLWIIQTFPKIFDWLCPLDLADASADYLADWRQYFLTPALYAIHIGLLLLFVVSLVMFFVRKPTDEPE